MIIKKLIKVTLLSYLYVQEIFYTSRLRLFFKKVKQFLKKIKKFQNSKDTKLFPQISIPVVSEKILLITPRNVGFFLFFIK